LQKTAQKHLRTVDVSFSNREGDAVSRATPAQHHGSRFRRFRSESMESLSRAENFVGDISHARLKFVRGQKKSLAQIERGIFFQTPQAVSRRAQFSGKEVKKTANLMFQNRKR